MNTNEDTYAQALGVALATLDALCEEKTRAADSIRQAEPYDAEGHARAVHEFSGVTDAYLRIFDLRAAYRAALAGAA